jgi:predicted ferric reductase
MAEPQSPAVPCARAPAKGGEANMPQPAPATLGTTAIGRRARATWRRPLLRPPRRTLAALLLLGVVGGAAAVVWLWWDDTPAGTLDGLGAQLTAAGRVTGLLGGYLLLVQVALMARIPWLERRIGSDWLAIAHRGLGEYLVCVLVAHAALIAAGYAVRAHAGLVAETVRVVLEEPDVLMATAGLALLVGVGALSARAVRRRLAYETWYYLHLYAYLAVLLAFAHQLAVGAQFTGNRAARAVWTGAHLAVAACLLGFRVGGPLRLAVRHRLRVAAVRRELPGVVSVYITGRELASLRAEAGQFFRWRFLTAGRWWQAHPYSLSTAPNGRFLRLTVRAAGDHSRGLGRLRPGARVLAEGPYGAFTATLRRRRRVLLLAGGVGVAPLRALLETLPAGPGEVDLIYRASTPDDVVFPHELDRIARARGAAVHYLLGSRGRHLLAAGRLHALVPDVRSRDVFVCGPPGMVDVARRELRRAGVPRRHIHAERFDL